MGSFESTGDGGDTSIREEIENLGDFSIHQIPPTPPAFGGQALYQGGIFHSSFFILH